MKSEKNQNMANALTGDLRGAVPLAHYLLCEWLRPGDRAVDATCGNGNDTLLLARLVGGEGRVWAFDIQPEALEATSRLLHQHGCLSQVQLTAMGHERLSEVVREPLRAVVFNLGFLPKGDRRCITLPETTVAALGQGASLLQPGGLLLAALYPGHAGGDDESLAVERWGAALPPNFYNVWQHRQLNRSAAAPYLVTVERRS